MARTLPALALSAALVTLLSGCVSVATAETEPPTPSIVAETPEPTAEPDPLAPPALVFDGNCSTVLTDAEVSAASGGPVVSRADGPVDGVTIAVQQLGGIRCAWDDDAGLPQVWITVIPHAAVADAAAASGADEGSAPTCYGDDVQGRCSFGRTVGEYWIAGVLYTAVDSGADAVEGIDALVDAFDARSDRPAPAPVTRPGAWPADQDCAFLDAAAALGQPDLEATDGHHPAEAGPGVYAALRATGYRSCGWWSASSSFGLGLTTIPGAGWAVRTAAAESGAIATPVDGAGESVAVATSEESWALLATDGVNLVIATPYNRGIEPEELAPAVAAAIAAHAQG
ncbi:hypothetical protein [Agromyces sp. NPDC057865]|uniref:hypothetical protein n=1 Tax=Agromyces sp. NPDC057865 TaxID=3346267 RepID=UPI003670D3E7